MRKALALLLLVVVVAVAVFVTKRPPRPLASDERKDPSPKTPQALAVGPSDSGVHAFVGAKDLVVGKGVEATPGAKVAIHYTASLESTPSTVFDNSRDRGEPYRFRLGSGEVIRGWDQGITGMRVGGRRTLTVPPDLGYGKAGVPPLVPPDATLVYVVDLVEVAE